jgi:hypothetical protein
MIKPIIRQIEAYTYYSGQIIDELRPFWYQYQSLKFFEAKCNSTWNLETERYYQILATDEWQAENIAKQTYAKKFHVKEYFVDAKL